MSENVIPEKDENNIPFTPDEYDLFSGNTVQNIPEIEGPDREFAEEIFAKISQAFVEERPYTLAGGFVYERHQRPSVDAIGTYRNPSYSSPNDEVVLQITVSLTSEQAKEIVGKIIDREKQVKLAEIAEKRAELFRQMAELNAKEKELAAKETELKG